MFLDGILADIAFNCHDLRNRHPADNGLQVLPHFRRGVGAAADELGEIARGGPDLTRELVLGDVSLLEEGPHRGGVERDSQRTATVCQGGITGGRSARSDQVPPPGVVSGGTDGERGQARGEQLGVGATLGRPPAELFAGAVVVNSP